MISLFCLLLCFMSIHLPSDLVWNASVMSGLVLLITSWKCCRWYGNEYVRLLLQQLPLLLNPWLIVEIGWISSSSYSRTSTIRYFSASRGFCHHYYIYNKYFFDKAFFRTARLWTLYNDIECFPLSYDLKGLRSRVYWSEV